MPEARVIYVLQSAQSGSDVFVDSPTHPKSEAVGLAVRDTFNQHSTGEQWRLVRRTIVDEVVGG